MRSLTDNLIDSFNRRFDPVRSIRFDVLKLDGGYTKVMCGVDRQSHRTPDDHYFDQDVKRGKRRLLSAFRRFGFRNFARMHKAYTKNVDRAQQVEFVIHRYAPRAVNKFALKLALIGSSLMPTARAKVEAKTTDCRSKVVTMPKNIIFSLQETGLGLVGFEGCNLKLTENKHGQFSLRSTKNAHGLTLRQQLLQRGSRKEVNAYLKQIREKMLYNYATDNIRALTSPDMTNVVPLQPRKIVPATSADQAIAA